MTKYERVKEWRQNTKRKLVEALGSHCQCCKYNKSISALELHHIDPSKKEFTISSYMSGSVKSWDKLKEEAKKCILLCSNCHREIHDETTQLPKIYQQFDESLIISHKLTPVDTECLVCKILKNHRLIYCSQKCANINSKKLDLTKDQLIDLLIKHKSNMSSLSREVNMSDNGIRKQCIKLNIDYKSYK